MSSTALLAENRSSARVRAALYALVTAAVVLILAVAEWDVANLLAHASRAASTLSEIAVAIAIAFASRPVHRRIEGAVEDAFMRRRKEARKALFTLARTVTEYRNADELLARIVSVIDECVGGGGSAVYVKSSHYHAAASSFASALQDVSSEDPLVAGLRTASAPLNTREYSADAAGAMACPMLARGELVGFLALGSSIEQLDADDRQTIMGLAQSAGLALAVLQPQLLEPSDAPAPAGNLPHEVASLVGREHELERIEALLAEHRLVCVKGPGGIGKSRLAARAAADAAAHFQDGAWFVDLTGATSESDILGTIAAALNVPQTAGKSQLHNIVESIRARRLLLILDNCEHVVAHAAAVAAQLLKNVHGLRMIATSRERLAIAGEAVFEVPPLDAAQSAELFRERAAVVAPDLRCSDYADDIAQIVEHLDGIPFAIELAAARLRVLSPRDLAKRIGNIFQTLTSGDRVALPRQQTLRAMLDWSYALLSKQEQTLFGRLGIFPATFGLDAAAQICSDEGTSDDEVVGLLGHLVDKSLVQVEAGPYGQRFRLLESGRVYAREQCDDIDASGLARRHAFYYRDLTHGVTRNPAAGRYDVGLEQLKLDVENVYASLSWALEQRDIASAVTLGEDLTHYWFQYTQLRTGREWLAKLLGDEAEMTMEQRAAIRFANACMLLFSDPELALQSAAIAVELSRQTGDKRLMAQALGAAGNAHLSLGDAAQAERTYEESAAIYDELSPENAALMRVNLANVLINFDETQLDRAQDLLQQALTSARRLGRKGVEGIILGNMAQLAHAQQRYEDAYALSHQSVETARALGARQQEAVWLYWLGVYATDLGRRDEASNVLQNAVAICRDILTDDAEHFTGCMEAVVTFAAAGGRMLDAARIHGFIESYRLERRLPRPPVLQSRYDATLSGIRSALGDVEFTQISAAGSRQSVEELLHHAIEVVRTT